MKQGRRTVMMDLRVMCNHLSKNMTVMIITVTLEKNVARSLEKALIMIKDGLISTLFG